ncbi:hypothetical protein JEQ12_000250 [Ovis aries]|uniref:Uncharacterized protein n=1 Tax=Ovis aries TaxID=9940 RepID=A0A836ACQ4_SHEEP|nr:hypothetical protein JEQ12_000250 [Ovis aries]
MDAPKLWAASFLVDMEQNSGTPQGENKFIESFSYQNKLQQQIGVLCRPTSAYKAAMLGNEWRSPGGAFHPERVGTKVSYAYITVLKGDDAPVILPALLPGATPSQGRLLLV